MSDRDFNLSPRKQHILRAVIRDYILTAEPVGSRTLSKKYDLGLSPATIRNELSDLEEEGLLRQPHTSAGRVPSDHGYRVFVDSLMEREALPADKAEAFARAQLSGGDIPDLLQQTAKMTALMAGCTALVRAPRRTDCRIKFLQLMPMGEQEILLILLTDQGQVTHQLVRLPSPISPHEVVLIANFLNEQLRDRLLDQLTQDAMGAISAKLMAHEEALAAVLHPLQASAEPQDRLIVSHQSYLAHQPEFSEEGKLGQLLSLLERDDLLITWMDALAGIHAPSQVAIGAENPLPDLRECSLVTATYRVGDRAVGEIAVLGPTRMHYATAIMAVEAMAERLSTALQELYGLETPRRTP